MRVAIMQPTYLPWLGYFDLMDQVDLLVFLDRVQFVKQSWHHRNRIKGPAGLQWLTVPVELSGRFGQTIAEAKMRVPGFHRKHLRSIQVNYGRAAHYHVLAPELAERLQESAFSGRLVDLNVGLIDWLADSLGIHCERVRSSALDVEGSRSNLLVDICRATGAAEYLSPPGSADYLLSDLGLFREAGITVRFHNYEHPEYRQLFSPFMSQASVLDLVLNEGPDAGRILRSGRRRLLAPEELSHVRSGGRDA